MTARRGRPPLGPGVQICTIRLTAVDLSLLDQLAERWHSSRASTIRRLIRERFPAPSSVRTVELTAEQTDCDRLFVDFSTGQVSGR